MLKEIIICTIIIVVILTGNMLTQNYSSKSIESINNKLTELEENIESYEINHLKEQKEKIKDIEEEIDKQWKKVFNILAYYIEHEELEKFAKNLENIKTYIKIEKFENAIKEIREGQFILRHIEDKYEFNLQNIF